MKPSSSGMPHSVKLSFTIISATLATIGLLAVYMGYAPERATRFGLAGPLFGSDASMFGFVCLLLAVIPLLAFARTAKHAAFFGTLLGIALVALIFGWVYMR